MKLMAAGSGVMMMDGAAENNENNTSAMDGSGANGPNGVENGLSNGDDTMGGGAGDDSGSGGGGENRLLFDFSNDMMFDSSGRLMRKPRRKHNPDRDKYIQEPQYVTKRTSSGRLVKMKISTDYDYTSDQEEEGKRRRSNLPFLNMRGFFLFLLNFILTKSKSLEYIFNILVFYWVV